MSAQGRCTAGRREQEAAFIALGGSRPARGVAWVARRLAAID
jgi:hypothetical protein